MPTVQKMAEQCLLRLVEYVFAHRTSSILGITYQDLATRIEKVNKDGIGVGLGMGKVLGEMGHMLKDLEDDWGSPIPYIQSLVVNKGGDNKDLPAAGISEFWSDYPQLTRAERESRVQREYERIVEFGSRWNVVLTKLGLGPITVAAKPENRTGYGESDAHKEFKAYVANHPEIVGATANWKCETEYTLPSLDAIDLVFRMDEICIAVEVKSSISDKYPFDYERGLYQTIKYKALLSAMARDGRFNIPGNISSVLVLASKLPEDLRSLAEKLGVAVIDRVLQK